MSCRWFEAPLLLEVFEPLETQFIKAVPAPCQTGFQIIAGLSTWILVLLSRSIFLPIVYILYICIDIHCVYILIYYLHIIWHIDILKYYVRFSHSEPLVIPQYTVYTQVFKLKLFPARTSNTLTQKGHRCLGIEDILGLFINHAPRLLGSVKQSYSYGLYVVLGGKVLKCSKSCIPSWRMGPLGCWKIRLLGSGHDWKI